MNGRIESQLYEAEARRLRAQYTQDWLVSAFVALDLAIRRAACRVFSTDFANAARPSQATARKAPCR